jgi:hypothetical protein
MSTILKALVWLSFIAITNLIIKRTLGIKVLESFEDSDKLSEGLALFLQFSVMFVYVVTGWYALGYL